MSTITEQINNKQKLQEIKQSEQNRSLKLCKTMLSYALQDRKVQHVINSLRVNGCNISESFFQCKMCSKDEEQGFHHDTHPFKTIKTPKIILASNNDMIMNDLATFKAYLLHELLLTFDYCRIDINYNNCAEIACTEIRASRLSGECGPFGIFGQTQVEQEMSEEDKKNNIKRNPFLLGLKSSKSMSGVGLRCIRKQSALNVNNFINCYSKDGSGKIAWNAVNDAWTTCFRDFEPFRDRVDTW
eukprot:465012_1